MRPASTEPHFSRRQQSARYAAGVATILVGIAAACLDPNAVTSTPAVTYAIVLGEPSFALTVGQSVIVIATIQASDGHSALKGVLTWSTADSTVAKVTASGVLTAVSPGTTTLRASLGATAATAPVTVTAPQTETIAFVATGSMSVARVRHTATLLRDGTVLIAGGSSDRPLSAELYDPVSRNFTLTGNMTTPRAAHTATLLPDGRVLIVGGDLVPSGQDRPLQTTAELYDPVTKTFARTGDVVTPQMAHTATLLDNGKVLIAGGLTTGCCPSSVVKAEIYDPSTGRFTETGSYAGPGTPFISGGPAVPTATLLRNGTVLLAGEPTAERYDPNAGTFSLTGAMLTQRAFGGRPNYIAGRTATRLSDGMVLLTGGEHEDLGRFSSAELYDPATGLFTLTGDMASVRDGHSASLLPNGSVLIAGGETIGPGCPSCAIFSSASAELYDPNRRTFTSAGNMNVRREFHTATVLNDGTVLIVGGLTFDGGPISSGFTVTPLASAELFAVSSQRSPAQ